MAVSVRCKANVCGLNTLSLEHLFYHCHSAHCQDPASIPGHPQPNNGNHPASTHRSRNLFERQFEQVQSAAVMLGPSKNRTEQEDRFTARNFSYQHAYIHAMFWTASLTVCLWLV